MKKWLLGDANRAQKEGCLWNMIASAINALEAVIILMVATRTVGIEVSGELTIGFTIANLMMCLGKYGVRNYQVTDAKDEFSFEDYYHSRIYTIAMMTVGIVMYLLYSWHTKNYSISKILIMFFITVIYGIEAYEDVFLSGLQHKGRLDIGTKMFSIRWSITLVVWAIGLVLTRNALFSTIMATVADIAVLIWLLHIIRENEINAKISSGNKKKTYSILQRCFPLCVSAFTAIYLPNAAKYAIDRCLSDTDQAYYGFVAMPVFVIDIVSFIIFQPMLLGMAQDWSTGRINELKRKIRKLCIIIFMISIVVLGGGFLLGVPILSLIYGVDLKPYKQELMILLLGGAALGFIGLFISVLTIMRKQKYLMLVYVTVSLAALVTMNIMVTKYGMLGGACWNTGLLIILGILLGIGCGYNMKKRYMKSTNEVEAYE